MIMMHLNLPIQQWHRAFKWCFTYLIMAFCGLLTLYIFASSYETTFNRPLPFIEAVSAVDLQPVARALQPYTPALQNDVGNYGKPQYLKLPSQAIRMTMAPAISNGDHRFLARASTAHYALTSAPKNGNIGDVVAYYRKSWRTDDQPQLVKVGDNIFVDTDRGWRYFYRVDDAKVLDTAATYIARDGSVSQLILAAVDAQHKTTYVAHAQLVNVQNIGQ